MLWPKPVEKPDKNEIDDDEVTFQPKRRLNKQRQICEICLKTIRNEASLIVHYQQHRFMDNLLKEVKFSDEAKRARRA